MVKRIYRIQVEVIVDTAEPNQYEPGYVFHDTVQFTGDHDSLIHVNWADLIQSQLIEKALKSMRY